MAFEELFSETAAMALDTIRGLGATSHWFAEAETKLAFSGPLHDVEPALPDVVKEFVPVTIAPAATSGRATWTGVAATLASTWHRLSWQRAYAELPASPAVDAFRDRYAWAPLSAHGDRGGTSPYTIDDFLLGFTIQAPNVDYPHHHHPPAELYGVLAGSLSWQVGDTPWATKGPGDVIVHRPGESHSMVTTHQAALCWALWPANTAGLVVMPSLDPDPASAPTVYG